MFSARPWNKCIQLIRETLWSFVTAFFSPPFLKALMELSKAPRSVPLTEGRAISVGTSLLEGRRGATGGGGGGGGAGIGNVDVPAVEGGVGDEGDVKGELVPEPELFELLHFIDCSSPDSQFVRFDFFRAKIFLFFFSSSDPWCDCARVSRLCW